MKTFDIISTSVELPLELETVGTDKGMCYYSHVHLQWFHASNYMPFEINEIPPHFWYKLVNAKK